MFRVNQWRRLGVFIGMNIFNTFFSFFVVDFEQVHDKWFAFGKCPYCWYKLRNTDRKSLSNKI